ncbi:MAG: hypothetical protein JWN00_6256, partial [Actinomycetia bacterium]|nr:hypothetical protein [Actinomycetes bacterium]
ADVILLKVDLPNLYLINSLSGAVALADTENVDTVFVAGRPVKIAGRLLGHHAHGLQDQARSSRDRLLSGTPFAV